MKHHQPETLATSTAVVLLIINFRREKMTKPRTESEQRCISQKIDTVLTAAGIPTDSRLRNILDAESEVIDTGREPAARIVTANGDTISHAARLEELRQDFMFKANFPAEKPTVAKNDMRTLSENFAAIAAGKVRVE
jgi:hypothetical protein